MGVVNFSGVESFIEDNVYHTELWDMLATDLRKKAVNNADYMLRTLIPDIYGTPEYEGVSLPVDVIAHQTLWLIRVDDTIMRAEQGVKSVWVDGTMISISEKDNSISPLVYKINKIPLTPKGRRRKMGVYSTPQYGTYRIGNKVKYPAPYTSRTVKDNG